MSQPIKILELFAGYGTATFALKELGIEHELVGFSEIDRFAHTCFNQNHGGLNYGDATKIKTEELPDFNLLTAGFPCQAFSVAGKGLGELDTRGTLFHEVIRIAEAKKPRFILLENVKGLTNKTHRQTFEKILSELRRIGYYVDWKILNSKDFGVPQNRERVWIVGFKEFEDREMFKWPEKQELNIFLKDILEENVDQKYFLSEKQTNRLLHSGDLQKKFSSLNPDIAIPMTARQYANWKGNHIIQVNEPKHSNNRIYSPEGISPTLRDMSQGGNRQPFILTGLQKHQSIKKDGISNALPSAMGMGGGHIPILLPQDKYICPKCLKKDNLTFNKEYISPNYFCACLECDEDFYEFEVSDNLKIRKLTPKECFRLQGFLNDQINLEGISDSQQYKLAGNGQTLNVVKAIFREMLK